MYHTIYVGLCRKVYVCIPVPANVQDSSPNRGLIHEHGGAISSTNAVNKVIKNGTP